MSGLKPTILILACVCIDISGGQHLGPPLYGRVTTTRQQDETTVKTTNGATGDGQTGNGSAFSTTQNVVASNQSTQSITKPGGSDSGQIVNPSGLSTAKRANQSNGVIKSPTTPSGNLENQHHTENSGKIVVYNGSLLVLSTVIMISKQYLY